jgi:PAS domain S-box-containing protein
MMRRALLRRRFVVAALSLLGALLTFAAVVLTDSSALTGAIVFAPWVMLIGVDSGAVAGIVAGGGAGGLWRATAMADSTHPSTSQTVVRIAVLCVLGFGSGVVGNQLRTSERRRSSTVARQRALIDATIDGICLTDVEGNILIVNEPLVRMAIDLGMPAEGTVAERLLAVADKLADPERYRQRMLEIADSPGQATTDEFELQGTGRVFRGYTSPVNDRRGRPVGRIWTLREVTADKELERMRDAFVATVSHELRTPLTSISGFLEMLQDEEHRIGDTGRTYLDVIRRSTERLHHLVEDLLLVAQIEARRVDLQHEPIDLMAVAERSVEAVRPWAAREKQVRVELSTNDVPTIRGDERRLGQVLDNLLSNAVKFSRDGGVVEVSVERNDGGAARVVVADHGIGIPADEQGHVFSRFYRARAANELAVPGTGLGLAITRALVDQHGGTIDLESREGEGTTVTVHLPAA